MYTISEPMQGATNMQSQFMRAGQIMECPACMEYMRPPITLCVNGHNICNICRQKVRHCPTCRHQFWDSRNVAWDKWSTEVKYPCVYRNYGCREIYSLDLIGEQQEKCRLFHRHVQLKSWILDTLRGLVFAAVWSHIWSSHTQERVRNTMVFIEVESSSDVSHLI